MRRMTVAFLAAAALQAAAADVWSRRWPLAENLAEAAGECPLFAKGAVPPAFGMTDGVRGVSLVERKLTANDHPSCGLAPGFRFSCKVRFDRLSYGGGEGAVILSKGLSTDVPGAFLVRVDPSAEGSFFSFFANTDGCIEPRVRSRQPARTGVWYDLSGGWDGETISLTVNGDTTRQRRTGRRSAGDGPFAVGPLVGQVADVCLSGPAEPVARDLPLSPGFGVACSVTFSGEPTGETVILKKDGEYQLRYDRPTPDATGGFHFFVCLDGSWEPRCGVLKAVEAGRRYDITAGWNGLKAFLQVDGEEHVQSRRGKVRPQGRPLRVGGPGTEVGGVAARSLDRALPVVQELRTRELMPVDGEPFALLGELANLGSPLSSGVVRATAAKGVRVTPAEIPFENLTDVRPVPLEWRVDPGKATDFDVHVTVFAGGRRVGAASSRFATMPKRRPDLSSSAWRPPVRETSAHYVDARAGDDGRDGRTPETAWRTFAHVNGRTLGPGERLLLRRGSVFTEELVVTAQGAADNWAEIAAYGEGARPILRRNRDIDDRCAHIVDPGCLVVRDLVFCNAGKGLDIVGQDAGRARGVLVERCLAHHIEGLYYNAHGIPEWRDRFGAPGPGAKGGLNLTGLGLRNAVLRDCETYQCSFGFQAGGRNTFLSRIYCHDNVCHNTSPHPFLTNTTRAWLVDSVFERSGWHASAGTMGIMLGGNVGLEIHGCHFLRQPDSDCPDEGGIDFECSGHNYLVDGCTFRGCAGAAIEILGLRSPQSRNVHIRGNRFDRNNFAKKLGPSEIFVWGGSKDRGIVCSSGLIEGNGFVLNPGVTFYTNQAVSTRADPNSRLPRSSTGRCRTTIRRRRTRGRSSGSRRTARRSRGPSRTTDVRRDGRVSAGSSWRDPGRRKSRRRMRGGPRCASPKPATTASTFRRTTAGSGGRRGLRSTSCRPAHGP